MIGSGGAATSRHLLTCLSGKLTDAAPAAPQCPARLRGRRPLGSFSRAAEELGVTHGAVSRHVQTLEQFLGAALFRPQGRGRVPTERRSDERRVGQECVSTVRSRGSSDHSTTKKQHTTSDHVLDNIYTQTTD